MRSILALSLMLITSIAVAQSRPPGCTCTCSQDLLVYECSGGSNHQPPFVLGDNTELFSQSQPASFDVSGLSGTVMLGNAPAFPVTIGSSGTMTRFVTSNNGECVGTSGDKFPAGVPSMIAVQGRALQVLVRNPYFCREPSRDLLCFTVRGQTGAPFPPTLPCVPDLVERVCGVVQ